MRSQINYILVLKVHVYDGIYSVCDSFLCFVSEISHLTSYPQTSSSNKQEFIVISIFFFFHDRINGDGVIQCVVIDNQIGMKT